MNYINAEEFLKQPREVQKIFIDWWKPEKGDLIYNQKCGFISVVRDTYKDKILLSGYQLNSLKVKEKFLPLLTESQLRQFIEDKTNKKYDIIYSKGRHKFINFYDINVNEDKPIYKIKGHDLLQAYWQVACQIAQEEVNK